MSSPFRLLTPSSAKIDKSKKQGYLSANLHLAPHKLSGYNVCASASPECIRLCLNISGHGGLCKGGMLTHAELAAGTRTNSVQVARVRRTKRYFEKRAEFMGEFLDDVARLQRKAKKLGAKPAMRPNGTSDIPWERVRVGNHANIMEAFPDVQFYDYTKRPNRKSLPSNYHLTFSLAEDNEADAIKALENGMNVAVVFHKVPETFTLGGKVYPVIDGDAHDLRFLDPAGVIVGLKAKGNAKRDTSGFVH
jgi:hypothetical protein